MKRICLAMTVGLLLMMVSACGYHLEGGGYLKDNTTRVSVAVFENKSAQSRAGIAFTNELIREIQEKTDTLVVDDAGRQIMGVIKSITFSSVSRTSSTQVVQRDVTAVMDVKLVDAKGAVVWSVRDFSATETYTVAGNVADDQQNINRAVDEIATRSAERIVSRMTANF